MLQPRRGFTLIEILVVIAIIGILTTVVTVSGTAARAQGRDAQRKADLQNVAASLEVYRTTNKQYPDIQSRTGSWDLLKAALFPTYISQWPVDPSSNTAHVYTYISNDPSLGAAGSMYALDATLENKSEPITLPEATGTDSNNNSLIVFTSGTFKAQSGLTVVRVAGR